MNPNRLLLLAVLALTPLVARAQLTLTQDDILNLATMEGTTTSFETGSSAALTALAEAEGAGRTWDFTGLTYGPALVATVAVVEPPVIGSDDPHFADADFIIEATDVDSDSAAYSFFNVDDDGINLLGLAALGEDGEGQPGIVEVKFIPGNRVFEFPLTFGTAWTSDYGVEYVPDIAPLFVDSRDEAEVVGWGTLVTPAGSADALMLRTKTVSTVRIDSPDPDTSFVVGQDSLYNISFLTNGTVSASITLDGQGNAESGSYSVMATGTAADPTAPSESALRVAVFPSPVRRGTPATVEVALAETGRVRVEVYDVLGRRVETVHDGVLPAGAGTVQWTPQGVPSGLYLVRVEAGSETSTRRVTVLN